MYEWHTIICCALIHAIRNYRFVAYCTATLFCDIFHCKLFMGNGISVSIPLYCGSIMGMLSSAGRICNRMCTLNVQNMILWHR